MRTDAELNEVGAPLMLYCRPAPDFSARSAVLPDHRHHSPAVPAARVPEAQFAAAIEAELARPGTIGVGYNTIRFDDEVTRFLFWRNLIDPLRPRMAKPVWPLGFARCRTHGARPAPGGHRGPTRAEGGTSFKLGDLTRANGLAHEAAHDALRATCAPPSPGASDSHRAAAPCSTTAWACTKGPRGRRAGLPAAQQYARPFWHVSGMFGVSAAAWPDVAADHAPAQQERG